MSDDLNKLGTGEGGTFWDKHAIRDTTPDHPDHQQKSRGELTREQQLADVENDVSDVAEANETTGQATTGNVSTRRARATAQRALKRQQQLRAGQYPSGE